MFTRRGADVSIRGMVEGIVDARASTRSFEHGGRGKNYVCFRYRTLYRACEFNWRFGEDKRSSRTRPNTRVFDSKNVDTLNEIL